MIHSIILELAIGNVNYALLNFYYNFLLEF